MAQKGTNLVVSEVRNSITEAINEGLQTLPVSIIKLILETAMYEITSLYAKEMDSERDAYNQSLQNDNGQVEYVQEPVMEQPVVEEYITEDMTMQDQYESVDYEEPQTFHGYPDVVENPDGTTTDLY